ncbi:MAG TPA: MogA/MoaB family molybdenum cofactor biosynthesis protein [Gemmatimonadaceae bacterium]
MRVAVLTISDAGARGERADGSGDAIVAWVAAHGYTPAARALVPDESHAIARQLIAWCDGDLADLVLTTGGTGLSSRDVTPEATRAVLEREAPGIPELLRAQSVARFPRAALSRGVAGMRNRTLIINLPGSTGGVTDGLAALDAIVEHAVAIVRGQVTEHGKEPAS